MDFWGLEMPLPDASKKSPRVYTNLQNIDLENVTFANIEATGNPIAIEEMNEDELRRLVLANLARLVVKGEWTGLLESGGGGNEFNAEFPTVWGAYRYIVSEIPPWGNLDSAGGSQTVSTFAKPFAFPFLSPVSGDVSEVGIYLKTSDQADLQIAIYSDDGGLPDSRMCYASIDMSSGNGTLYQTSITGTATLVRGTQYWFSMNSDADPGTSALYASRYEYIPGMGVGNDVNGTPSAIKDNAGDDYDLPAATFTSSYAYNSVDRPAFSIKVS